MEEGGQQSRSRSSGSSSPTAARQPPPRFLARGACALAACAVLTCGEVAHALDAATVGTCLLEKCQRELGRCLADEKCAESLVCLNACNGTPDEAGCQIRCGDLYADQAVRDFNACAVTANKCVPQRVTPGAYPLPATQALVQALDLSELEGRWYITAGLNPLFDTFPCQVHYFTSPEPGKMFVRINWRVSRPNGQFYERTDLQRFVQDANQPGAIYNHDNEVLHYQDDWYIAAYQRDEYFLVYYRGRNDAWDGYGGAVVYTRAPALDPSYVPALREASQRLGLKWDDFVLTDNTCAPAPRLRVVPPRDLDTLADDVVAIEAGAERSLEDSLQSFSRGFTVLRGKEQDAEATVRGLLTAEQRLLRDEFEAAERTLQNLEMKARMGDFLAPLTRLFGGASRGSS